MKGMTTQVSEHSKGNWTRWHGRLLLLWRAEAEALSEAVDFLQCCVCNSEVEGVP